MKVVSYLSLVVFFILSVCSLSNNDNSFNVIFQDALSDSLKQIDSVSGFTLYTTGHVKDRYICIYTSNIYIKNNNYKQVSIRIYDGFQPCTGNSYTNLLTQKSTEEGILSVMDSAGFIYYPSGSVVSDLKGYNKIYIMTPTVKKIWDYYSSKSWENQLVDQYSVTYYLVKESDDILKILPIIKTFNGMYQLLTYNDLSDDSSNIKTYFKQK